MNIPGEVKIGGMTYKVLQEGRPSRGDIAVDGQIRYDMGEISLKAGADQSADYIEYAFLHECMHGIMYFMGLDQANETLVDALAKGLHAFIKDNPAIFGGEPWKQH